MLTHKIEGFILPCSQTIKYTMLVSRNTISVLSALFLSTSISGFTPRVTAAVRLNCNTFADSSKRRVSFLASNSLISCYQDPSSRNLSKLFSTKSETQEKETDDRIPITLLAGFLGSGKTTTLSNLLQNNDGKKIGIIVNDVASINIDNKLLANPNISKEETIELQNGCACCDLAGEMLTSVEKLMNSGNGKREFDAIVVELSGVADPMAVKNNWADAEFVKHPATKLAKMEKVVTLVDSSTFGTDWMSWDTSGDRQGWVDPGDCEAGRHVPELLSEQIEAADVLIVNKIDLSGEEQVAVASSLARNLNDKALLLETKFGEVSVKQVLEAEAVDHSNDEEEQDEVCNDPNSHDHSESCSDPACNDPSHSHSHSHDHGTSTDNLGITNFVYKSDRPFDPTRLLTVLNKWPVSIKDELDLGQLAQAAQTGYNVGDGMEKSPFVGVLRSKGFCWMAPTKWSGANEDSWRHNTAM